MIRLEELTIIHAPIQLCFDLARNVEVHLAGNVHWGEQTVASGGVTSGIIGLGQHVTWRAKHFGIWQELTSQITALEPPSYFQDVMLRGAFKSMTHDHHFRSLPSGATEMKDIFVFAAPLPVLGLIAERLVLRRYMQALLHERNVALKTIAESGSVVL
jgi:ligand-binding SRPBCC domain-containing protein